MKIVLHICCAVCASGATEKLIQEGHQVFGYFFNPNIYPPEEYYHRLNDARRVSQELGFSLSEGPYIPEEWARAVAGLEIEPEGGSRCSVCFKLRLQQAHKYMLTCGCDAFTCTLTMSSNKPAAVIGRIGRELAGEKYLEIDFKKKDGLKRANELAKKWNLYRQHYCGCVYSLKAEELRRAKQYGLETKINLT
jgi:predicted adenine nucleotide alpha hydrolase (AANH) superfamily ATPase